MEDLKACNNFKRYKVPDLFPFRKLCLMNITLYLVLYLFFLNSMHVHLRSNRRPNILCQNLNLRLVRLVKEICDDLYYGHNKIQSFIVPLSVQ